MKILVINNGSTSSRFSLIDTDKNIVLASGGAENLFTDMSYYKFQNHIGNKIRINKSFESYEDVIEYTLNFLFKSDFAVINSLDEIDAVGHRVVHSGGYYDKATEIDDQVLENIRKLVEICPLHNAKSANTIEACRKLIPNIPNIAVFDTAFHSTIPKENYTYALPHELVDKYNIKKYGFHGISYSYVLKRLSKLTNRPVDNINTVMCHMGGGCSMVAVKNGQSYDTTMGYSPLSGMLMSNRIGSIDPAIIPLIMKEYNMNINEVVTFLNEKCGYYGICGNNDSKTIVIDSELGNEDAMLCRTVAANDFRRNLFSMMSNLPKVDSIVLTGGMLSRNYSQRELFFKNLNNFGILLDVEKNKYVYNQEAIISEPESVLSIYVIPTDEEAEIANECMKLLNNKGGILRKKLH